MKREHVTLYHSIYSVHFNPNFVKLSQLFTSTVETQSLLLLLSIKGLCGLSVDINLQCLFFFFKSCRNLTYSKMWQQVNTVRINKARNLQGSWAMVHDGMNWCASSSPSGCPSPGSATAPGKETPAPARCQDSPFSSLCKKQRHKTQSWSLIFLIC